MTTTRSIPLRRWIHEARNNSGSQSLSSGYISNSLRIAISLTEQISDAEELSAVGLSSGLHSLPLPFPVACIDWADCVTVTLKSSDAVRDGSSLASLDEAHDGEENLENLLDLIALDAAEERELSCDEQNCAIAATERDGCVDPLEERAFDYLHVECAQIAAAAGDNDEIFNGKAYDDNGHADAPRDKLQRIYSLGLVLYELFSGGDLPPPDLLLVSSCNGNSLISLCAQAEKQEVQGMSNDHPTAAVVDFGKSLIVSDENDSVVEDSMRVTGTLNHDSQLQDDASIDEFHARSISSKRHFIVSRKATYSQNSDLSCGTKRLDSRPFCNISVEHLNTKGVPRALCHLIYNMIDCINGDFMGNDAYTEMAQVTNDLHLMIDKPSIFLNDLDVTKLSLSGLELDDTLFVRGNDEKFACLQCSYRRSLLGSPELALITGLSGTGKSTMAYRFGDFIAANGGLFLSGKFDQMQQIKPFSAVASAFNNYCESLAREKESQRDIFVAKLRAALGPDLYYLIKGIPNLSQILEASSIGVPAGYDCVNAQERLQYLFCQFVEVISSCSRATITLFMDDVQWADSASISIIGQLLKRSRSMKEGTQFFFLASCRDDEMESDHLFWEMIKDVNALGYKSTLVKLDCMDKDEVNETLSNLLHLSPRLVSSLSNIVYRKTKGNPLFFSRMLLALNREGLLRISLTRHRWEWDEENIQSRELPEDVVTLFVNSINMLSDDVKAALGTLSCFGASVDIDVIHALESDLTLKLIDPLNVAIAEGLVSKLEGRYHFCHDRIQEAVYSMIEEETCFLDHNKYGMSLMSRSLRTGNTCLLFTAITQVNLGGPSAVQVAEHYPLISYYNLIAGKKAMEMSDFSSAFSYFDHGITFLRKKHWQDHYHITLELFNLAAKCALAIKKMKSLSIICAEVLRNARNFEDTLHTAFVSLSALTHSMISESVEHGISILSKLDVDISGSYSREDTLSIILQTQAMLNGISDEALLNYRVMTDYRKETAMKFLAKLENSIQQVKPALQPLITVQMVKLTIDHGMSPLSAVGFAYFGGMVSELGDIRGGFRFTRLAKALVDKFQSSEIAGEAIWLTTESLCFIEPLQTANEYRLQGQAMAMATGDIHWACLNKASYCGTLLWCGVKLSVVKETFARYGQFMEEHNHLTTLYYMKTIERTVIALIGDENEMISDDALKRVVIKNKNPFQLSAIYFQKMLLSLVFDNYNEMKESTEKFIDYQVPSWVLLYIHAGHTFIASLASFRIFRETGDPYWAKKGKIYKERVLSWKEQGSLWNFESKSFLLEAEGSYCEGNFENAEMYYDRAISSASQHKFWIEEALSCELAANFYLKQGKKSRALQYFKSSLDRYQKWGAFGKIRTLHSFIEENFECQGHSLDDDNLFLTCSDTQRSNSDTRKRRPT